MKMLFPIILNWKTTISTSFHKGIAHGLYRALIAISQSYGLDTIVLSGGVFQNELLLEDLKPLLEGGSLQVWTNHAVPPNDGGLSLGQAALAAFGRFDSVQSPVEQDEEPDYA